jgi:NADPH:quinone reductase-like Zn-dependent oxidoreductase
VNASHPLPTVMKAVRVESYGGVDALHYKNISMPVPDSGQVLVQVKAAGVGPWDAWIRSGKSVLPQPLPLTLGSDISGTVVQVAPDVQIIKPGDQVFGVTNPRFTDGYAEYAIAYANMLGIKPARLSHEEAASAPVIAVTAWQMLFDQARILPSQRVLILGGAGNVGAYAVQLANMVGAHVIATASNEQADFVRSLGAREIIEARTGSLDAYKASVDVVIDLVGGDALVQSFEVLKPGGVLVSAVADPDSHKAEAHDVRAGFMLVAVNSEVLAKLAGLFDAGKLKTRIGDVLPLAQARLAHEMLDGKKHKPGKILLIP